MSVRYSNARNRRTRHYGQHTSTLKPIAGVSAHPSSAAEMAIDWLSVVDEFKIRKHRNVFPRWSLLVIVLAVMAL